MNSRKWWLLAAFGILTLIIIVINGLEDVAQVEQKRKTPYLPPVSIVNLQPGEHKGVLRVAAEIKPRWDVTLRSQVNGEVEKVFERAFAGARVEKGDVLIDIEDSRYRTDLREAEQALAEAKLNLLQAQKKSSQDRKNWQRSGIRDKPSELVLNIPQLEVARKTLSTAKVRADAARKRLSYTRVKAPFPGFITHRYVSIGQTVLDGDELLRIIQDSQQEIIVSLDSRQWSMLPKNWKNRVALIRDADDIEVAQARIVRGGGYIDAETRQYKLFLEVIDASDGKSTVGDFVQVILPTHVVRNSLAIPESALTRSGYIWYLNDENQLRRFIAEVLFYRDNQVVIKLPSAEKTDNHNPSSWRIATTPLASFMVGRHVHPIMAGEK